MAPTTLFRFDAGCGIGLGHFSRCLSLAEALRRAGWSSVMLTNDADVEQRIVEAGHGVERRTATGDGGVDDVDEVRAAARRFGCRSVVVDSYCFRAAGLASLRRDRSHRPGDR